MPKPRPNCPSCHASMEEGYVLEYGHGNATQVAKWVEGPPAVRKWLGMNVGLDLRERDSHTISSFRCTRCGLLQEYALEA